MPHTVQIAGAAVSARWLRDHGDDVASINPESLQRVVDTFAIPRDITALGVEDDGATARVSWSDGAVTSHDLHTLRGLIAAPRSAFSSTGAELRFNDRVELWSTPPSEPTRFSVGVVADDAAWPEALRHLETHGWLALEGATLGFDAVQALAGRIGYPRATVFGDLWEMASGSQAHKDSAYDPVPLDLHTDGTYSHDAPGTIIFSQQEKDGSGGHSVLADGFAVARDFAVAEPEAADLLTRYEVRGRYAEPGVYLQADRVPIRCDAQGVVRQVTFNNYDRAPMLPDAAIVDDVLDAYAAFRSMLNEPERALELPWSPGRMLVFDNWRLFHGRTAYTGNRVFFGCYTNHEDLESAYRLSGDHGLGHVS